MVLDGFFRQNLDVAAHGPAVLDAVPRDYALANRDGQSAEGRSSAAGWTRLSAGDGAKGPRGYDWRRRPLADPLEPGWHRWLLVRRSLSAPMELTAYVVFAPHATPLQEVVRVAGAAGTRDLYSRGGDLRRPEPGPLASRLEAFGGARLPEREGLS